MTEQARPQRPSADKTRGKIIEAARRHFLQNGFHGVSVQQIADEANVNQNLIFHHFHNKRTLWQSVKQDIVDRSCVRFKPDVSNLRHFVRGVVEYCFALYDENPDLTRLIGWQQLEINEEETVILGDKLLSVLLDSIHYLQRRSYIKPEWEPAIIIAFFMAVTLGPFLTQPVLMTESHKKNYLELAIRACIRGVENKP